jgi:superfamily II DNA/RNA helicase
VLIATDAMTRGMDVEGIRNVINYDMPSYVKTYIHRAGRTARAELSGQFLLLISIIKLILLKIRVKTVKFQIYEWQRATVSGAFQKNNETSRSTSISLAPARVLYI